MIQKRFENIRLIPFNVGIFRTGAAVTIPGLGIISGNAGIKNKDLLRHEFGHLLQFGKWGFIFYWLRIAPASMKSARKAHKIKRYSHMDCWTEWSANLLSYHYFEKPSDWDFKNYPVKSLHSIPDTLPRSVRKKINDLLQV